VNESKIEVIDTSKSLEERPREKRTLWDRLRSIGIGSLAIGGGVIGIIFYVLQFVYVAGAGLSTVWFAIGLFQRGSILGGMAVLLIGTPISIWIASAFFYVLFPISIIALIVWGIISVLGIVMTFENAIGWVGGILMLLGILFMLFTGTKDLIKAIRERQVGDFFKENLGYILLFVLFLWWVL